MAGTPYVYQTGAQQGPGGPPPPPPPKRREYPYHDGLSRSAQQYDLFEMIRQPNLHPSLRPPTAPSSDNYQDPNAKKKKLLAYLQGVFEKNNYQLPKKQLNFLVTFVRIFFLFLILPIYFTFYRIPKWLFIETIPWICNEVDRYLERFVNRCQENFCRFLNLLKIPFKKMAAAWKELKERKSAAQNKKDEEEEYLGFFSFILEGIWALYYYLFKPIVVTPIIVYR